MAHSVPQPLLGVNPEEILPRRFYLRDTGLLLISADFSAPANQPSMVLVKQRFHFSGADLLLMTADSSVPDDKGSQIPNTNYLKQS